MVDSDVPAKTPDNYDQYIAIWAKAVDTQMHFNEMSVKSRQLGLTFVAGALGVCVVLLGRGADYSLPINFLSYKTDIHISVFLILGALLALYAVKVLDLNVYHKMLRGAVSFGEDFEENYMKKIFELDKGMTQAVSHFSRHQDATVRKRPNGRYEYLKGNDTTAESKIRQFYNYTMWFLAISAVTLFVLTNLSNWFGSNKSDVEKTQERAPYTAKP